MNLITLAVALSLSTPSMDIASIGRKTVVCTDNTTNEIVLVAGQNRPIKVVGWVGNQVQFSKSNAYRLDREIFTAPANSTCFKGKKDE